MTTMDYADFVRLGFNINEAKTYLALINRGGADAATLIKDTKFHKNIVYDNLEKLLDKGLIDYIVTGGRKVFQPAPANMLLEHVEEKQKEVTEQKALAKQLSTSITAARSKTAEFRQAEILRGKNGIRAFYEQTLRTNWYCVFGAPAEATSIMGEAFWANHNKKRHELNITARMIFNSSLREYSQSIVGPHTKIKFFDQELDPLTETHVEEDRVAILVWSEEPIALIINDENVAGSYIEYFERMWKEAKP